MRIKDKDRPGELYLLIGFDIPTFKPRDGSFEFTVLKSDTFPIGSSWFVFDNIDRYSFYIFQDYVKAFI